MTDYQLKNDLLARAGDDVSLSEQAKIAVLAAMESTGILPMHWVVDKWKAGGSARKATMTVVPTTPACWTTP